MPGNATILYVDPYDVAGHRAEHLALYLRATREAGLRLCVMAPSRLWEAGCAQAGEAAASGELVNEFEISYPGCFAERLHALDVTVATAQNIGASLIYFPLLDFFWLPMFRRRLMGRGMGTPWSGVIFGDDFNFLGEELLRPKRLAISLLKIPLLRFLLSNEAKELLTFNISWKMRMPVPVTWLPDAFSQGAISDEGGKAGHGAEVWPAARFDNVDAARTRFLLVGAMEPRKGLVQVAEAFLSLHDNELRQVELRVLGRFIGKDMYRARVETLFAELARRGAVVEMKAEHVLAEYLDAAIRRCDYILAPYIYHVGSSGVMGLAAQYGRPLLSQDVYQIGADVRRYSLGLAVNTLNHAALVVALRQMVVKEVMIHPDMRRFKDERLPACAIEVIRSAFLRMAT